MQAFPVNVHYFQHVPFEHPAGITAWLADRGCRITSTLFYDSWQEPDLSRTELLIVMGGPMGTADEALYPWLAAEKRLIAAAIAGGIKVLGICLGAQLVAAVLGAAVTCNPEKEIGWYPVILKEPAHPLLQGLPAYLSAFHWHGDTFALPAGAHWLFASEGCPNQGFLLNEQVLGLQFHLELDLAAIRGLLANCRSELVPGRYIQPEAEILACSPACIPVAQQHLRRLLENFFKPIEHGIAK